MNLSRAIEYLRSRSDRTKSRIMVGTVATVALVLGGLWLSSIGGTLGGVTADDLAVNTDRPSDLGQTQHFVVEGAENRDGRTLLYVKASNPSPEILNLPPLDGVYIRVGNRSYDALGLTNRQNQPFAVKALTGTDTYGIVVFPEFELEGRATLILDDMFYERSAGSLFREEVKIDLGALQPVGELRS